MKNSDINLMPVVGAILLTVLYICSLCYRGILTAGEYDFVLALQNIFPGLSGTFLPKLPAALATLASGGIIFLAAYRLKLLHPGVPAGLYLCFPPVWWIGTSATAIPVLSFLITVAAAGLFTARKEENFTGRLIGFAIGCAGAIGAAALAQTQFFSWWSLFMALFPVLFLAFAIHLEKLDDRNLAGKRLNRIALFIAVILLMLTVCFLLPSICRFMKISIPAVLKSFYAGKNLYLPSMALLVPLLWLYVASKAQKSAEKVFFICFAVGFVMLMLPPSLPWSQMTDTLQKDDLLQMCPQLLSGKYTVFADDSSASAVACNLRLPVQRVGRGENDLPPAQLREKIIAALTNGNVAVFSDDGELDAYLPVELDCVKYTSAGNCKLYLYSGTANSAPEIKKEEKL